MATTYYVDPAAAGNNDGSTWTHAWTTIQSAADTAVAGDLVKCRGTETLAALIDFDTNSGSLANGFIKFVGCNAAGDVDGTRYVLNANGARANCIKVAGKTYIWLENFELTGATAAGFGYASAPWGDWVFINVISHNNGTHGFDSNYSEGGRQITFVRCRAYANGSSTAHHGWSGGYQGIFVYVGCESIGNTGHGFAGCAHSYGYEIYIGSIAHDNGADNFNSNLGNMLILGGVIDAADVAGKAGVRFVGKYGLVMGARLTNNTAGLVAEANMRALVGWSYFGGNTDDISGNYDIIPYDGATTHVTLAGSDADDGYVDQANHDFNLTDGATGRNLAMEID
jgi:hypothetical protein